MEAETNERTKAASKLSEMCKALKVEEFFWEILEICNDPDSNQLSLAPLLINLNHNIYWIEICNSDTSSKGQLNSE